MMEEKLSREESLKLKLEEQCRTLWPAVKPEPYFNEQQLYEKLHQALYAFVDLPEDSYYHVSASFILLSQRVPQFETVPYLHLWGQTQSGKTRLQKIFRKLCRRGLLSSDLTPATVYQSLTYWHPTLLADERDKDYWKTEMGQVMLSVLNSGYQRDVPVLRANREGGPMNIYDTFGPKTISGIRDLPYSLGERCIRLRMESAVRQVPMSINNPILDELAQNMQAYHEHYKGSGESMEIDLDALNEEIGNGRATELFGPLYTVCPSVEGKRDLLSLAKETVADFHTNESVSELAEVLDALVDARIKAQSENVPLHTILEVHSEWETLPDEIKKPGQWVANRIRDLGFKAYRTNKERGYKIDLKRLESKLKRLSPALLSQLSLCHQSTISPLKSDSSDSSDSNGGKRVNEDLENVPLKHPEIPRDYRGVQDN